MVRILLMLFLLIGAAVAQELTPVLGSKATVHFYRERAYVASLRKMPIFMNEQQIADLVNGRFFVAKIDPGKHVFRCRTKLEAITVELVAGGEYYFRAELIQGFAKNHWRVIQVTNEQGASDISRLKPADAKDVSSSLR
jgi:hypothetical protein